MTREKKYPSDKISSYFYTQIPTLNIIAGTGILYNIGMIAGPWFEGRLAQYLCDIIEGKRHADDMLKLACIYVLCILLVQCMRYFKRLYVRKFGNHINRSMKGTIYRNLVHHSKIELEQEGGGALMTKALFDAEACSEGMRKFTTEIFDTGVVMIAYLAMLLYYDWRLTLLVILFPPLAFLGAGRLKGIVTRSVAASKKSAEALNEATLDRISNAITYRVYGQETQRNNHFEQYLADYEQKSIIANLWEATMQPIYQMIAMVGTMFILWFGGRNVMGNGWCVWDIAAFSTFFSCFAKLAVKSSKSAKLFNAVQKAFVSWKRVKPYLSELPEEKTIPQRTIQQLKVTNLSFGYQTGTAIFSNVNFQAKKGEIIGITGEIACGKSTLGKMFLNEYDYEGSILLDGIELRTLSNAGLDGFVGYLGHAPELMSASIRDNICMGETKDPMPWIKAVRLDKEISEMSQGLDTQIGGNSMRLSGGQQSRLALCRTLYHKRPLLILDDPFSAVDLKTEKEIMEQLRSYCQDCIILLISHRISLFNELDGVLWMKKGCITASTHKELVKCDSDYRKLYELQMGGAVNEEI